jgi:hypothetical protein
MGVTLEGQHSIPRAPLQESWVELLSRYHWDLFGSLTFREETHPESAYKRFRLFVSKLNRKLYGPRWFKHNKGISYCLALEHQRRGVVHFHCLLAEPELVPMLKGSWFQQEDGRWANELNELWNELAGFARIEPVQQLEAVRRYVSKYVLKGGEIDLGGPLFQTRLEQARRIHRSPQEPRSRVALAVEQHSDSVPVPPGSIAGTDGQMPRRSIGALAHCSLTGQPCKLPRADGLPGEAQRPAEVRAQERREHEGSKAISLEAAPAGE